KDDHRLVPTLAPPPPPPPTPSPELPAPVVTHRHPALLHLPHHSPAETGRINNNGEVGPAPVCFGDELVKEAPDLGQMTQDFSDAYDGEVFCVDDEVAAGSAHLLAADPEKLKLPGGCGALLRTDGRGARPHMSCSHLATGNRARQRLHQLRAVHFSRSFPR